MALAWGLDFIPLSSERFDLVFPQSMATDPRVERLIDELSSPSFRRELDSLGGYETRESGHVIRPTSKARRCSPSQPVRDSTDAHSQARSQHACGDPCGDPRLHSAHHQT